MGACYEVDLVIKTRKERELIENVNKYVAESNLRFYDNIPANSIDDIAKKFLAAHQRMFDIYDTHSYSASFDATYSWELVLLELWDIMEPYLEPGSYIDVWPDTGHWTESVE